MQREDGRVSEEYRHKDITTKAVANSHKLLPRLHVFRWRAQLRPFASNSIALVGSRNRAEGIATMKECGGSYISPQSGMRKNGNQAKRRSITAIKSYINYYRTRNNQASRNEIKKQGIIIKIVESFYFNIILTLIFTLHQTEIISLYRVAVRLQFRIRSTLGSLLYYAGGRDRIGEVFYIYYIRYYNAEHVPYKLV